MSEIKLANHTVSLVSAAAMAWTLAQGWETWNGMVRRVESIESRMSLINQPIPIGNRWTCFEHREFVYQLQQANPKLKVPPLHKECAP